MEVNRFVGYIGRGRLRLAPAPAPGATCIDVAAQNHLAPVFVIILQPHQFRVVFPNGFGILCAIASSQIITGSFLAIPSWDQ
jgi:hypothetical protein